MRGRNNGSYPYKYPEMIDSLFGKGDNTIEVCSGMMGKDGKSCFTVDINPKTEPDLICVKALFWDYPIGRNHCKRN